MGLFSQRFARLFRHIRKCVLLAIFIPRFGAGEDGGEIKHCAKENGKDRMPVGRTKKMKMIITIPICRRKGNKSSSRSQENDNNNDDVDEAAHRASFLK